VSDAPDFHKLMYIARQGVYLELIQHWQARIGEYFGIVYDSGPLSSGTGTTAETTIPAGECWYISHVWGQACITADITTIAAEIIMLNYDKSIYFAYMSLSRVGFKPFPFAVPYPADPGDRIRLVFNNVTPGDQRYYAGIGGYKIPTSSPPKPWRELRNFRKYLNQPGIVAMFYELGERPVRITVYNTKLRELCRFGVRNFQKPNEEAKLIELIKK